MSEKSEKSKNPPAVYSQGLACFWCARKLADGTAKTSRFSRARYCSLTCEDNHEDLLRDQAAEGDA